MNINEQYMKFIFQNNMKLFAHMRLEVESKTKHFASSGTICEK